MTFKVQEKNVKLTKKWNYQHVPILVKYILFLYHITYTKKWHYIFITLVYVSIQFHICFDGWHFKIGVITPPWCHGALRKFNKVRKSKWHNTDHVHSSRGTAQFFWWLTCLKRCDNTSEVHCENSIMLIIKGTQHRARSQCGAIDVWNV